MNQEEAALAEKRARLEAWKASKASSQPIKEEPNPSIPSSTSPLEPSQPHMIKREPLPPPPVSSNVQPLISQPILDLPHLPSVVAPTRYHHPASSKAPAPILQSEAAMALEEDLGLDPLDAFMAAEILPEVAQKKADELKAKDEERARIAEMMAKGENIKKPDILEESDDEEVPDLEIQIPTSKVKLLVGPNGTTIGSIQRNSKARVQIKKEEEELMRAFGSGPSGPVKLPPGVRQQLQKQKALAEKMAKEGRLLAAAAAAAAPLLLHDVSQEKPKEEKKASEEGKEQEDSSGDEAKPEAPRKMTTVLIYGDQKTVEMAERLIFEAIDNREQKQKQRQREYEKKREEKRRARTLYHMRHAKDYETLELQPGASKVEVKKSYRRLAMIWHPDKHTDKDQEEAKAKFQLIQKAYDALMSTDEEEIQMQIAGK